MSLAAPSTSDPLFQPPITGGIWCSQVCWSFAVHVHEIVRNQIMSLETLASEAQGSKQTAFRNLADKMCSWPRERLIREADAWLKQCPLLAGMYQFTFIEMIRHYSKVFPTIREMGIRVPSFTDFTFLIILRVYEDPLVRSANFCSTSNSCTFAVILQRLNEVMCEAMKVSYFPKYSPATSALWKIEPQIQDIADTSGIAGAQSDL